jgi:hypothetical protein
VIEEQLVKLGMRVGGRYRNRVFAYEVLALKGSEILVQLDDGTRRLLNPETQARIMKNLAVEEQGTIPPKLAEDAWAFTLGGIAGAGRLEAEVPPQAVAGFIQSYRDATGEQIGPDTDGFYPITTGGYNKWGAELRVYVPTALAREPRFTLPHGVRVVTSTSPGTMRTNNNGFWWFLVERNHLRIGSNWQLDDVRGLLPEACRRFFDDGANFVR